MKLNILFIAAILAFGWPTLTAAQELKSVTLDGSASFDPDGTIVSYEWSENGQIIATGVNPTISLAAGTHTITLKVTDDLGATDTDTMVVTIVTPNQPPVAHAGPDQVAQIITGGSVDVVLDGTGSFDPDGPLGKVAFYRWRLKNKLVGFGEAPVVRLVQGTHTIMLEVEDYRGATDSDFVVADVRKKRK